MPLLFQYMDDDEHLFVVDLIVLFYRRQRFAVVGHQVPFLRSRGEVRAVRLDVEEFQILRQHQDWSSGHHCLEMFEGFLFLGIPVPGLVGTSEVEEGPGDG